MPSSERSDYRFQRMERLSTFVLAGGRGKRLYPLTRDRAKPAVRFGGIYNIAKTSSHFGVVEVDADSRI